jgi:hypothetical protein
MDVTGSHICPTVDSILVVMILPLYRDLVHAEILSSSHSQYRADIKIPNPIIARESLCY